MGGTAAAGDRSALGCCASAGPTALLRRQLCGGAGTEIVGAPVLSFRCRATPRGVQPYPPPGTNVGYRITVATTNRTQQVRCGPVELVPAGERRPAGIAGFPSAGSSLLGVGSFAARHEGRL